MAARTGVETRPIRVAVPTYDRLARLVAERTAATGRAVSYGEVIERLLDLLEEVITP